MAGHDRDDEEDREIGHVLGVADLEAVKRRIEEIVSRRGARERATIAGNSPQRAAATSTGSRYAIDTRLRSGRKSLAANSAAVATATIASVIMMGTTVADMKLKSGRSSSKLRGFGFVVRPRAQAGETFQSLHQRIHGMPGPRMIRPAPFTAARK